MKDGMIYHYMVPWEEFFNKKILFKNPILKNSYELNLSNLKGIEFFYDKPYLNFKVFLDSFRLGLTPIFPYLHSDVLLFLTSEIYKTNHDPVGSLIQNDKFNFKHFGYLTLFSKKYFNSKYFDWKEKSWAIAYYMPDLFDSDKYNWQKFSWIVAQYCPQHFNPNKFNWENSSWAVAKFCPQFFDSEKYNWEKDSWAVARFAPQYLDEKKYNWKEDSWAVLQYCPQYFDLK